MNTNNIIVNTQSSIRLELNKIVYFDPYKIEEDKHDADVIFITHNHYDHFDVDSINKIKKEDTIIVAPKSIEKDINEVEVKDYIYLNPFDEIDLEGINIKTIPSYNIGKPFHPKDSNFLGYIVTYNNIFYYIAGDSDNIPEAESVKCDIAFLPIGGTYTMNVEEAASLAKKINPKVVIPIHYGSIIGSINNGKEIKELLTNTNIEIIEKL